MRVHLCAIATLVCGFSAPGCEQNNSISPDELERCRQFISDIENCTPDPDQPATLIAPQLSPGVSILVSAPYAPTDAWLLQNTQLSESSRKQVMDDSVAIENMHVFVLAGPDVAFHSVLDARFNVKPSIFVLHAGDRMDAVLIDRESRPVELRPVVVEGGD